MYRYLLLIVLYKKSLSTSDTIASLIKIKRKFNSYGLILWDNSNDMLCTDLDHRYLSSLRKSFNWLEIYNTDQNFSLSYIYNFVIDKYSLEFDYLIILDHDTLLTDNYFSELEVATINNPDIFLFVPIVLYNRKIVSPARFLYFKGFYFKSINTGIHKSKFIRIINSGTIIKFKYFHLFSYRYDTNLRFYGTDDHFMINYSHNLKYFFVLNSFLDHKLNFFDTNEDLNQKISRYREIKKATLYLHKKNKLLFSLIAIYFILKSIELSFRYKTFYFIAKSD